jgi:hypothetical protein
MVQHRCAQLVQHRERDLYLRLDARCPHYLEARRRVDKMSQQSALADTRLAAHDEDATLAAPNGVKELFERTALTCAPDQSGSGRSQDWTWSRSIADTRKRGGFFGSASLTGRDHVSQPECSSSATRVDYAANDDARACSPPLV